MARSSKSYAFIDGSFNPKTKIYGCGGYLIDQSGKKHIIQQCGSDKNLAKMRNVAGELLGVKAVIDMAKSLKMKKLTLFYDYAGIENWVNGEWKCKKHETKMYRDLVHSAIKNGLEIIFKKVDAHTGVAGNEEADQLAKLATSLGERGLNNL